MKRKVDKKDILKQGVNLMYRYGYHGTGVKGIADAAGILKGSFYNYFESKEIFCQEVLVFYAEQNLDKSQTVLNNPILSALDKLQELYTSRISMIKDNPSHMRGCLIGNLGQELADTNKDMNQIIESCILRDREIQAALIENAQHSGLIKTNNNADELAEFIMNSWQGALWRMKSSGNYKPLHVFYETIFNHILI